MISPEECIRLAEECERLAGEADTEATRMAFHAEAKKWRALAEAPDAERALIDP